MNEYKSINEIAKDYNNGEYRTNKKYPAGCFKEDHIFDENNSVKWNREEVFRKNNELVLLRKEYNEENQRLSDQLRNDVVNNLTYDYDINQQQAELIYDTAYTEKHSCMTDVFYYAAELAEYYEKMEKLSG